MFVILLGKVTTFSADSKRNGVFFYFFYHFRLLFQLFSTTFAHGKQKRPWR